MIRSYNSLFLLQVQKAIALKGEEQAQLFDKFLPATYCNCKQQKHCYFEY